MNDGSTQLRRPAAPDPEEAKLRLLEWSIEADEELHEKVQGLIGQAKKAAPWAAGIALVSGWLLGRKRRKREKETPSGGLPISTILRIATMVTPIVLQVLKSRREQR